MSETMRLSNRNALIQEMLSDGERLKDFYRFTAQNPHYDLHDACQIVIAKPNASICFSFEEWNAMERRVTKGRKGVPFIDRDSVKRFAFDVTDTHGEERYKRLIFPMKRLLIGLDKLNGTELTDKPLYDYRKIQAGVSQYLQENDYFTDDEERNRLISEGVSYSLYCKTGFPKNNGVKLHGMPYELRENADLFRDIYVLTDTLKNEIEEAYVLKQQEIKVIEDIDEKTISDEPIIKVEPQEVELIKEKEHTTYISPIYKKYLDAQSKYPDSIVVQRLGDFYEIMGENAKVVADKLDLTLTGRDCGLPERVPMVGYPFHVAEEYTDKIREEHSVVVVEGDELIWKPSIKELFNGEVKTDEELEEQDESEETEEWRSRAYERQDEDADEFEEDIDLDELEEIDEQPQEKKQGKPISERKRREKKEKQFSLFDLMDEEKEEDYQSLVDKMIERQLKKGSSFENGKMRICDEYEKNPTEREFAEFLKKEYGIGGFGGGEDSQDHDARGIRMSWRNTETHEIIAETNLKWTQVAVWIADLIDDDKYLSASEKEDYESYKAQRYGSDESRVKAIVDSMVKRGTRYTRNGSYDYWSFGNLYTFVKEHSEEIAQELEARKEVESVKASGVDFTVKFHKEYCSHFIEEKIDETVEEQEEIPEETVENTDLNAVGFDQNELGGAKARFRSNVLAIETMRKLYQEGRDATPDERKILAKYVGWGGLAKAFDEHDEHWQKEYAELKNLLAVEEYSAAKGSVLNAHYTSKEVIDGMYLALQRFGVKGNNRILEPALGTGNFFGFMPKEISENAKLYGVELDTLTGKIASKLYPNANVQIKGFEQTTFINDSFDVVVSNVPFGAYSIYDSEYAKYNFFIHDYFLAKSIDKLKPDGVMAVITSKGTMDKLNPTVRKHLADRAELLGAIRLPNKAFKTTANTEVVADILFFRKRHEQINADTTNTEWLATGKTEEGYEINNYFVQHPEMILGTLVEERGLYGAVDVTVKPDGRDLSTALNQAIENLPADFYINPEKSTSIDKIDDIEVDYDVKPLCYKAVNGKLYMRIGDTMVKQDVPSFPKDAYQRIVQMIGLRQELRKVLEMQISGCSDNELQIEQWALNDRYDRFVKQYGYLNSQTNARLFRLDGDSALLLACENLSEDKKTATKADIFSKRTIRPYVAAVQTDDCFEALHISMNERGRVDIAYIEELTKKDYDTVHFELGDAIYRNPAETNLQDKYSGFETAEKYLSGRVKQKLGIVQAYCREFPNSGFERNITALEQVQPKPLTASEISVRIGSSWVDKDYYKRFLMKILDIPYYYDDAVSLYYNPHDSSWRIDKSSYLRNQSYLKVHEVYGTNRANAYRLFEDCLNLRATTIYDTVEEDGKEKRVLNQAETIAAREKQNKIKEEFKDWIFADPDRREELEARYNALFNQIRLPSYDGSYLKFPEMNPAIELKPHQRNAVHRIISEGNTLLHHVVGAGKTFTICASIMKLRQYGLAKKPMIAVPNHLVQQWANEFRTLYPNAKLLIASKEDLDKNNRQRFVSRVAMGDWDAVIIAQSSFAKIPISPQRQERKLREEIARIEETIEAQWMESNHPKGSVKNLERIKKSREAQLKKLMDDSKKDDVLIFENLGVDYLFVDEAHNYKNLFLFTKMNNVAGISNSASQRASDLKLKCEYINELHGCDKGVVFATGTPISNSMTEMYTMQSYLGSQMLHDVGINYFDGWAADFGETITSLEMAPSGQGYKAKTRFAKFTNLPELLTLYRSFADVQTSDMVKLDVPDVERQVITLKPSDTVIDLAEEIADRAEKISLGGVPPEIDNMLKITSDGKKLALDARCYVATATDEETSKLNECAERVFEVWNDTHDIKGTQLVFCDLSTPKRAFEDYEYGKDFDVYNDLKYKLVQKGIPAEQIAFIHEANSDLQKQSLFDNVNNGKVRVLLGSTEKCGAGTNVQKRLVALHHLDTPYRPSDMQQREGRIVRQGNTNDSVKIFTYVTERTFDSYSYQILENKQRFISQIDRGDLTVREADDIDETTLSYAEIKAITAANPKIKRKMEVDTEVARLRVLEGQYKKNLYALQDKIRKTYPDDIRRQEIFIERTRADMKVVEENYNPDNFTINVNGVVYTDKKEGSRALTEALYASKPETVVAEFAGFKISMNPLVLLTAERSICLAGNGQYNIDIGQSASGNMTRIENFLTELPNREKRLVAKLEQLKTDLAVAEVEVQKPFEHAGHLADLLKEQTELNAELDLNRREEVIIDDDNEEGDNYMALPESVKKEESFIDSEDKIAGLKVDVLPDYSIDQEEMETYGYKWKGMLPLRERAAKRVRELGMDVYKLYQDDTESGIDSSDMFEGNEYLYGVEKPDWISFIQSERGKAYLATRYEMCKSASTLVNKEIDYVDEGVTLVFNEINFAEKEALKGYVLGVKPDKEFIPELLEEFTKRIYNEKLNYYGWYETDVTKSLANNLENNELNEVAQEITKDNALKSFIQDGLKEHNSYKDMRIGDVTDYDEAYEMATELKSWFEDNYYAKDYPADDFDGWYDDFMEEKVIPIIMGANYKEEETKSRPNDRIELNCHCKEGIEQYIKNNFDGMRLNTDGLSELVEFYGAERIKDVLANTIQLAETDGRYSISNKEWAKEIEFEDSIEQRRRYNLLSHPAVLDGFTNAFRTYEKEMLAKQVDEELEKEIDNMTVEEATEFLGVEDASIDYKDVVQDLVDKEFQNFQNDLIQKEPKEIFMHNYEIHVKTELMDTLLSVDFEEKYFKALYAEKDKGILNELYLDFIGSDRASVDTGERAVEFIEDYCQQYHQDILDEYDEIEAEQEDRSRFEITDSFGDKIKVEATVELYTVKEPLEGKDKPGLAIQLWEITEEDDREIREPYAVITKNFGEFIGMKNVAYVDLNNCPFATQLIENNLAKETGFNHQSGFANYPLWQFNEEFLKEIGGQNYKTYSDEWDKYMADVIQLKRQGEEEEEIMPENGNKNKWVTVKVSHDACISEQEKHLFMKMPNDREYSGYTYNVFKSKVKESRQLVDMESDGRELCYEILLLENEAVVLHKGNDEVELSAEEFKKIVDGTSNKDYERETPKDKISFSVSGESIRGTYEKSSLMALPEDSKYAGYGFYVPNAFIEEDKSREDGYMKVNMPEDFTVTARNRDRTEEVELSAKELAEIMEKGAKETGAEKAPKTDEKEPKDDWKSVIVPAGLSIAQYEKSNLMRMPEGEYEGYVFYYPNTLIEEQKNGDLKLKLPPDFTVNLKNNKDGAEHELTAEEFIQEVKGKKAELYQKPSETKSDKFAARKALLDSSVPQEMKDKPNWVIVRTKENAEKGRLEKYLIDCHTGKFARSDDHTTWTDYETACKYASENGGVTLAYALDGKDGIACIDLDGCIDENGKRSELADEVLSKCGKTYIETSISGKGIHVFGTTKGMDVRTFSKDGDMEFYQKAHFISMTGDGAGFVRLESFDKPDMKSLIERKCEKRTAWNGVGAGVEGLSVMSDRDVVEKACKAKHGDTFKALYEGQDLQNNHSNSDMSLMNRLAFWCNGDKEQMLRIFATSGLFRPDKSPDYYEGTAIKAIKDTSGRFQQTQNTYKPKPPVNNSGNGKR